MIEKALIENKLKQDLKTEMIDKIKDNRSTGKVVSLLFPQSSELNFIREEKNWPRSISPINLKKW